MNFIFYCLVLNHIAKSASSTTLTYILRYQIINTKAMLILILLKFECQSSQDKNTNASREKSAAVARSAKRRDRGFVKKGFCKKVPRLKRLPF